MIQFVFVVGIFVTTLMLVVRFGFAPARASAPVGYLKVACFGALACIGFIWSVMAFVPNAGRFPNFLWSSGEALRWLAVCVTGGILSLFAPLLVGFGVSRRKTLRTALIWAIPLGIVAAILFALFSTAFTCLVFFSC